ncbi:hypothetical protein BH10BAC2_BH10BAC2_05270 [soil metagenome]
MNAPSNTVLMLSNMPGVQECDATGDAIKINSQDNPYVEYCRNYPLQSLYYTLLLVQIKNSFELLNIQKL